MPTQIRKLLFVTLKLTKYPPRMAKRHLAPKLKRHLQPNKVLRLLRRAIARLRTLKKSYSPPESFTKRSTRPKWRKRSTPTLSPSKRLKLKFLRKLVPPLRNRIYQLTSLQMRAFKHRRTA